jgi:hypothetical protein
VRAVFAAALAVLVLVTASAPHAHETPLGRHACAACVAAGGEEAVCAAPDVAPRPVVPVAVADELPAPPVTGLPLGAVPGQSPPRA